MKTVIQISIVFLLICCKSTKSFDIMSDNTSRSSKFKIELEIFTKTNELRKNNIDFIAYKNSSIGSTRIIKPNDPNNCKNCDYNYSIYLIWKVENDTYLQRFDNCGQFYPIKISYSILDFMNQNFESIKIEIIKNYQINNRIVSAINHSTYKEFLISKNKKETYNYFDIYQLSSKADEPNINFEYNHSLKIIKLNYMIEKEIIYQESLGLFKRDLSKCIQ